MRRFIITILLAACDPEKCKPTDEDDSSTAGTFPVCATHPYGRAIGCGGVEEPQTTQACVNLLDQNQGICVEQYIACRDAIRIAACDECPPECDGLEGAC